MKLTAKLILTLALTCILLPLSAQQPNDLLVGVWEPTDNEKRVVVEVFENSQGEISGKIIGAYDSNGQYRAAPAKRAPLLVRGFNYTEKGTWKHGRITDPEDGEDYSGRILMLSKNKIEVRAYLGIFWKDMEWSRIGSSASSFASAK